MYIICKNNAGIFLISPNSLVTCLQDLYPKGYLLKRNPFRLGFFSLKVYLPEVKWHIPSPSWTWNLQMMEFLQVWNLLLVPCCKFQVKLWEDIFILNIYITISSFQVETSSNMWYIYGKLSSFMVYSYMHPWKLTNVPWKSMVVSDVFLIEIFPF